jgi:hypothetical protein
MLDPTRTLPPEADKPLSKGRERSNLTLDKGEKKRGAIISFGWGWQRNFKYLWLGVYSRIRKGNHDWNS